MEVATAAAAAVVRRLNLEEFDSIRLFFTYINYNHGLVYILILCFVSCLFS